MIVVQVECSNDQIAYGRKKRSPRPFDRTDRVFEVSMTTLVKFDNDPLLKKGRRVTSPCTATDFLLICISHQTCWARLPSRRKRWTSRSRRSSLTPSCTRASRNSRPSPLTSPKTSRWLARRTPRMALTSTAQPLSHFFSRLSPSAYSKQRRLPCLLFWKEFLWLHLLIGKRFLFDSMIA